jgi:hypothetical protein
MVEIYRVKSKTNPKVVEVSQFEPQTLNPGNQHSVIMNPGLFRTLIGFSDENADVDRIIVRCGPRTNPINWRVGVETVRAWRETEKIGERN